MNDIVLTTFIIGSNDLTLDNVPDNVEIIKYKDISDLFKSKGEYISFIDSRDSISSNYFSSILNKIDDEEFDSCFINYRINYDFKRELKIRSTTSELDIIVPIKGSYIWNYVFKKELFLKMYIFVDKEDYNQLILNVFNVRTSIPEVIYYHNKDGEFIDIFGMVNRRVPFYYKNIIYMESFCNGLFNGYITWLLEIGKVYKNRDIVIIYTNINEVTKKRFEEYFQCVQFDPSCDYVCDNLVVTYATYFYPVNIHSLKSCNLFIHGNMSDFENAAKYSDDIYDRYIAVSKVSSERAKGYFPTDNIEYIYNPFTFEKSKIKPHLTLISAIRNSEEKGVNRIKKAADILDAEGIPYTWSVFTDVTEENHGGLIFRKSVTNAVDYMYDADYLVQFSKSEALPYSMIEALSANTKVITTDVPAVHEVGVVDGVNGFIIPLEYFDDGNEELLKDKLLEAYKNKNLKFKYSYDHDRFSSYDDIFK